MIITLDTENKIITVDEPILIKDIIAFAEQYNIDLEEWRIGQTPELFDNDFTDFLDGIEEESDNGVIYHTTDTLGNC